MWHWQWSMWIRLLNVLVDVSQCFLSIKMRTAFQFFHHWYKKFCQLPEKKGFKSVRDVRVMYKHYDFYWLSSIFMWSLLKANLDLWLVTECKFLIFNLTSLSSSNSFVAISKIPNLLFSFFFSPLCGTETDSVSAKTKHLIKSPWHKSFEDIQMLSVCFASLISQYTTNLLVLFQRP